MTGLFIHDHKFPKYKEKYFNSYGFDNEFFKRYTKLFSTFNIVGREIEIDIKRHYDVEIINKNINFTTLVGFRDLINKKEREKIKHKVKENNYIIIRLPSVLGLYGLSLAKKYKKPYLVEVVGCAWDGYWNHNLKGKVLAPMFFLLNKRAIKNAPYVVYVTSEFLQKKYPTNGYNTNCSNIALPDFNDQVLENRLKKIETKDINDKIIIGTAASVNIKFKGQQYIIKALSKLKEEGIVNYEYHLVGGGDQAFLKSIAEKYDVVDQVKFLGAMPHKKVFDWLETIDIYAQPSRQEGLPRALIEAMSRAVPAFGARTAGIPELLDDKFIFSNTRTNIDELIEILKSFDKATMTVQAKRNYEESKKYDKEVIEERRRNFFEDFKNANDIK